MIPSEILEEKERVQIKLSRESASIHEYLVQTHIAAREIAASYGFSLKYAETNTAQQAAAAGALVAALRRQERG